MILIVFHGINPIESSTPSRQSNLLQGTGITDLCRRYIFSLWPRCINLLWNLPKKTTPFAPLFPPKNLGLDIPKKTGLEELEELISHCSLDYVTHQGFMVHRTG